MCPQDALVSGIKNLNNLKTIWSLNKLKIQITALLKNNRAYLVNHFVYKWAI